MRLLATIATTMLLYYAAASQTNTRLSVLERQLDEISALSPGLNDTIDFTVTGISIQEFMRGLADVSRTNISVDPKLEITVYNNFTNVKVKNIIIFLCKEYQLDISFTGSIMSFGAYIEPAKPVIAKPAREVNIRYSARDSLLSMDLQKDSLQAIAKKITELTHINLVLSPLVEKNEQITLFTRNSHINSALEELAYSGGLQLKETQSGYFVLEPVAKEVGTGVEYIAKVKKNRQQSRESSKSGDFYFELHRDSTGLFIDLDANNVAIETILTDISREAGIDFLLLSKLPETTTIAANMISFDELLVKLLKGSENTYKKSNDIYMVGKESHQSLRHTQVFHLQFRSFTEVMDLIPAELKKGVELKNFNELNSIVLSGSQSQINDICAFISSIDRLVPMIMIEAIIIDIRKGKSVETELGLGFGGDPKTSAGSISGGGLSSELNAKSINAAIGPFNLGKVDKNFYAKIKALEKSNNIRVRSTPKLSTLNGHEANMKIGQTRYYSVETQSTVGSLQPNTIRTQQYNSVNADMTIKILPIVSGNEYVTMQIEVNNTDFTEMVANQPPPTATSSFNALVRVRDGEMVVLGGLERTEKTNIRSGVPILNRIPLIKWMFGSHRKSDGQSIMMVFVKPTILH